MTTTQGTKRKAESANDQERKTKELKYTRRIPCKGRSPGGMGGGMDDDAKLFAFLTPEKMLHVSFQVSTLNVHDLAHFSHDVTYSMLKWDVSGRVSHLRTIPELFEQRCVHPILTMTPPSYRFYWTYNQFHTMQKHTITEECRFVINLQSIQEPLALFDDYTVDEEDQVVVNGNGPLLVPLLKLIHTHLPSSFLIDGHPDWTRYQVVNTQHTARIDHMDYRVKWNIHRESLDSRFPLSWGEAIQSDDGLRIIMNTQIDESYPGVNPFQPIAVITRDDEDNHPNKIHIRVDCPVFNAFWFECDVEL